MFTRRQIGNRAEAEERHAQSLKEWEEYREAMTDAHVPTCPICSDSASEENCLKMEQIQDMGRRVVTIVRKY